MPAQFDFNLIFWCAGTLYMRRLYVIPIETERKNIASYEKTMLTSQDTWEKGVLIVRVMTGFIILKYGLELFDNDKIIGYTQWLTDTNFPMPKIMTYVGKTTELIGGLLLILGLFTRIVSIR